MGKSGNVPRYRMGHEPLLRHPPYHMYILRHPLKLTQNQRKAIGLFAIMFLMSSSQVQAAEGVSVVPETVPVQVAQTAVSEASTQANVLPEQKDVPVRVMYATITAYASVPGETDDSPFITADGSHVRDGIVAANFLKFGTRIRIPQLSGDKVYEVHDRMNKRFPDRVDVWVDSVPKENTVGLRRNYKIEIL